VLEDDELTLLPLWTLQRHEPSLGGCRESLGNVVGASFCSRFI
jgi:hypothetical protein